MQEHLENVPLEGQVLLEQVLQEVQGLLEQVLLVQVQLEQVQVPQVLLKPGPQVPGLMPQVVQFHWRLEL